MTSASTATESVPGEGEPPVAPAAFRVPWLPIVIVLAVVGSFIGANNIQVPYYAIAPGDALAVRPLVRVVDGPSFTPKGSMFLCTVSLGPTTIFEALQGWLDPNVDVVPERVIVPPNADADEVRTINLQAMDTSKEQAIGVAFEELGYDAITGGGAEIVQVQKGSPGAGLLVAGDVITAIDGTPVELDAEAVTTLRTHEPGDVAHLTITPKGGGAPKDVPVTLGTNPDGSGRPFVGVNLRTAAPRFNFPYKVDIASDRIGGPSAGLAFTLQVLDQLTKGELTGGRQVAATGTIELDGSVGEVGGVAQKTAAVRAAGVHLFLVPTSEVADARRHAGKGLRVEGVRNIHDALRILAGLGGNGLTLGTPGRGGA